MQIWDSSIDSREESLASDGCAPGTRFPAQIVVVVLVVLRPPASRPFELAVLLETQTEAASDVVVAVAVAVQVVVNVDHDVEGSHCK